MLSHAELLGLAYLVIGTLVFAAGAVLGIMRGAAIAMLELDLDAAGAAPAKPVLAICPPAEQDDDLGTWLAGFRKDADAALRLVQ